MPPRPHRMREALQLRGLSERAQAASVRAVRHLAAHAHTSPARLTDEDLRDSFRSLTPVKPSARCASPMALCGPTGFSAPSRTRAWAILTFVRAPRATQRPVLLRVAEVHTLLAPLKWPRSRPCLTPRSSCGLRLHEGTHLPGPDLDRARLLGPVRHGQGATDREGPRPLRPLACRRQDWQPPRHPPWLVPAPCRGGIGLAPASTPLPRLTGPLLPALHQPSLEGARTDLQTLPAPPQRPGAAPRRGLSSPRPPASRTLLGASPPPPMHCPSKAHDHPPGFVQPSIVWRRGATRMLNMFGAAHCHGCQNNSSALSAWKKIAHSRLTRFACYHTAWALNLASRIKLQTWT
jgi:hypothetical protein